MINVCLHPLCGGPIQISPQLHPGGVLDVDHVPLEMRCRWPPLLPALACALLLNSALHVLYDQLHYEPCEMTWMYQHPQYQVLCDQ